MSAREPVAAREREVEVPGMGLYASLVTVAFLAGLLLGWMIWGAP